MRWALLKRLIVKLKSGKVNMKHLTFLSAEEEDTAKIAQANSPLDEIGSFIEEKSCKPRDR